MKSVPTNLELLEIKRLIENQNCIHNQLMMLKDLMIKFAAKYPDVVKNCYK